MRTMTFRIDGMHCDGCAATLERLLRQAHGVRAASVSYETGLARLVINPKLVTPDALAALVAEAGFSAQNQEEQQDVHGNG